MNKKQVDKDVYELSKTLYGAERFKLALDHWNEFEKDGRSFSELPQIYTTFDKRDELEDYKSIVLDFIAINGCVWTHMRAVFKIILLSIPLAKANLNLERGKEVDIAFKYFSNACATFFAGVETIREKKEKYSYELLSYNSLNELEEYLNFLDFLKKFSFKLDEEKLALNKEMFSQMIREIHRIADMGSN